MHQPVDVWVWILFNLFILILIIFDLFVLHRGSKVIKIKDAILVSGFWISLALAFNVLIYHYLGPEAGLNFLTGYLIEKSLSVDNIFVFLLLFKYFHTPKEYQYSVLFWGILGAIVMRAAFIYFGLALITNFHWVLPLFGTFLVYSGIKMAFSHDEEVHPENNPALRLLKKVFPMTQTYENGRFFVNNDGKWFATPLLAVLVAVETTDLIFALDSIPAIMAITLDPFIIYTSNIFAILGLRSLYFALAGTMDLFHHLHYGLAAILSFVGFKMIAADYMEIPISWTLLFIFTTLLVSIGASLVFKKKK